MKLLVGFGAQSIGLLPWGLEVGIGVDLPCSPNAGLGGFGV